MTYVIHSTLIDSRSAAIDALAEAFVTANGLNSPDEIRAAIEDAEGSADEIIEQWGGTITTQDTDEDGQRIEETVSRDEWVEAIRGIIPPRSAHDIEYSLRAGERIEYEEIEAMREDDFREIIRPIAYDNGEGWVLQDDADEPENWW